MSEGEGDVNADAQRKNEERERKKAEVRKRLEEAGKAGKKAKKGFLTPERKKKLRKLLMVKAAEDLKRQQQQKDQERQKALASRIIPMPNIDSVDDKGKLEQIYNELFERVKALEAEKYDINFVVGSKENEINLLNIEVNDLRGKFAKPQLKKVSKYDNKFKKMAEEEGAKKSEKVDFRTNLKVVKKDANAIDEAIAKKKKDDKPDWSKKGGEKEEKKEEKKEESAAPAEAAAPEPEPAAEPEPEAEEGEEEEGDEEEEEEE